MKRFSKIDIINGSDLVDYKIPEIKFTKSLVDKSSFVPIADAVHSLTAGNRAHVDDANQYDFADGADTGVDVSFRKKGRDLAEIYQDVVQGRKEMLEKAQSAAIHDSLEKSVKAAHKSAEGDSSVSSGAVSSGE